MADVFLSYKAEDRRRVEPLVAALEADGLSVWWDPQIGGGTAWRQAIQRELDSAKSVIVLWSKRSIGPEGHFVHDEATRAQRRGVYLPVLIDKVDPPLGFGEIQALPLTAWRGDRSHPRYQAVLARVRKIIGEEAQSPPRSIRTGIDRRVVLTGGAALALAGGVGAWALWRAGGPSVSNAIAIIPFNNLSNDPDQAYFAEGLAEELRSALARINNLKVVGRVSSDAVRDEQTSEAARKLGVTSLLTGSVRRSASMIRVSAQLLDGSDGAQRWAQSYDRPIGDALYLQADIANNVARALRTELGEGERDALTAGGTKNAAAYDLYLKANGLRLTDGSEATERQVISLLDAAVALDPEFANAHALKAINLTILTAQYAATDSAIESGYAQAEAAARRAIALAPELPAGYGALGELATARLQAATALTMFQRAQAAGTADASVLRAYGRLLAEIGRHQDAITVAEQFVALEPLAAASHGYRALILFYAGRYEAAISSADRLLQLTPNRPNGHLRKGDSLVQLGRAREALGEFAKMPADNPFRMVGEAIAATKLGDSTTASRAMAKLQGLGDPGSYQQAQVLAQQGNEAGAMAALERALARRDPGLIAIRSDPYLAPLRPDARFQRIEKQLRLP
jgi:serine/threonine-protein kinase